MKTMWGTCANHMKTMWGQLQTMCKPCAKPHENHVGAMCKPCANHVQTMCKPCEPCAIHLGAVSWWSQIPNPKTKPGLPDEIWLAYQHMVIKECHLQGGHYLLLKYIIHLQDLHVQTMWKPHENHVGDMCKPHENHVGTIANHVQTMCKTTWKPCWGHVQTMCKPCANHVQTMCKPCAIHVGAVSWWSQIPNPKTKPGLPDEIWLAYQHMVIKECHL